MLGWFLRTSEPRKPESNMGGLISSPNCSIPHLTRLTGLRSELNLMEMCSGSLFIFKQLFHLSFLFDPSLLPDGTLYKSHNFQVTSISSSIMMTHSQSTLFKRSIQSKSELQSLIPFKACFSSTTQDWPMAQSLPVRKGIFTYISLSFILLLVPFLLPLVLRWERGNWRKRGNSLSLYFCSQAFVVFHDSIPICLLS